WLRSADEAAREVAIDAVFSLSADLGGLRDVPLALAAREAMRAVYRPLGQDGTGPPEGVWTLYVLTVSPAVRVDVVREPRRGRGTRKPGVILASKRVPSGPGVTAILHTLQIGTLSVTAMNTKTNRLAWSSAFLTSLALGPACASTVTDDRATSAGQGGAATGP